MKKKNVISVHTDGSASRKAGDGGWAFVAKCQGDIAELYGFALGVTNNQMELMGVIRALEYIDPGSGPIRVFSDSQYVLNTIHVFMPKWKKDGWKNVFGEPPKNLELIQQLDKLIEEHRRKDALTFCWVRGHDGNRWNERADVLAGEARKQRITNWS